ncbi:ornithine aminotransferase [Hymenopellis radicata]|nr:ornithine aminotransferase [Hymenopellis radicata]
MANTNGVHLSSADVIRMEHEFGAHNYHPLPVVFDRALGAKVWDPEGKEYIDMLSAYSPTAVALLPRLLQLRLPLFRPKNYRHLGYDMVLPMNTGAEAVETALKLSRKWAYMVKGVPENSAIILSVEGNFHGRTLGVETKTIRYGVAEDVERALALYGEKVAAFLVEPIQGEAGIVVPPEGYLARVAELCKAHNVLFICDEIQTGLCRTGKMLASEWDGVRPDIVLGKALSGGLYPVSAVLADKAVMLCIKPGEHGSTYGGNPLGCAVAIAALDVLRDENLAERAQRLGEIFRTEVAALGMTVRGRGLLNAVVFQESDKKRSAWQFCLLLKSRGVLAKPTHINIVRFAPALVIEEEDMRQAIKIIGECYTDQLEDIPGEVESEVGYEEHGDN